MAASSKKLYGEVPMRKIIRKIIQRLISRGFQTPRFVDHLRFLFGYAPCPSQMYLRGDVQAWSSRT